ncbi:MAG: prephenate dehydrogenase/arogenate dehydrogenase family protein [Saprospiraceae bacterium]|nr:prephenate dehydrogenase/arogenate dehydrogenase family protein [Saprospiraceae bacterium]
MSRPKNIICEGNLSDKDALATALKLFESLGMVTTLMSADEHDKHLAYVSSFITCKFPLC